MQGPHPQGCLSQPTLFPEVGEKHYMTSFQYRRDLKIMFKYVTGVKKKSSSGARSPVSFACKWHSLGNLIGLIFSASERIKRQENSQVLQVQPRNPRYHR